MDTILTEKYNNLVSTANQVISIFNHFYGEDKVDVQNFISLEEFLVRIKSINILSLLNVRYSDYDVDSPEYSIIRTAYYNDDRRTTLGGNTELFPVLSSKLKECTTPMLLNRLELPNIAILVYFPKVTITNEQDKSIDIHKLFAKITIDYYGCLGERGLTFNRAEYTKAQFAARYKHSHIRSFDSSVMSNFQTSCLGSGPIRDSHGLLTASYDEDLWQMFCLELSQYVKTESIAGGPYMRMESILNPTYSYNKTTRFSFTDRNIGDMGLSGATGNAIKFLLSNFIVYLGNKNILPFSYSNNNYHIALGFSDTVRVFSNAFIAFYNEKFNEDYEHYNLELNELMSLGILKKAIITPNQIQIAETSSSDNLVSIRDIERAEEQTACIFKGERIPIHIIRDVTIPENDRHSIILDYKYVNFLFYQITVLINLNYGTRSITTNSSTGESTTNYRFKRGTKTIYLNY